MFTTSTTTATAGLPDFDVVAIYLSVALFHYIVCLGFDAIALATIVAPILGRASRRLTMGIHLVAYEAQLAALSGKTPMPTQLIQLTPLTPTVTTIAKISPAMPAMTSHGTHTCVLLTSSTGAASQRANASRARDMLHDLGVAFREMDAAETPISVVRRYTQVSKTHGVYPQLFVEPTTTPNETEAQFVGETVYVPFAQLEQMEFFAAFSTPTTAPTLGSVAMVISITHTDMDALYPAWRVYVACGWGDYNFEDVWDFYTAMKLYSLMP